MTELLKTIGRNQKSQQKLEIPVEIRNLGRNQKSHQKFDRNYADKTNVDSTEMSIEDLTEI